MSYDLFFTSPKISRDEFEGYFSNYPLYQLNAGQAFYENEITGVYFSFDHAANDDDDLEFSVEASFNANFYRPHFFGLEAAIEVERFVSHFKCQIEDPQNEGMVSNKFTKEGFLKGWNTGNKFAVNVLGERSKISPEFMPTEKLEKMWRWNYTLSDRERNLVEDIFIPRIIFLKINGVLGTCAVWPDAIPTYVPNVDFLYVPRKECVPQKLFGKSVEDKCIISNADFPDFFQDYSLMVEGMRAFKLPSPKTPGFIKKYVSKLESFEGEIEALAIDTVLNQELLKST